MKTKNALFIGAGLLVTGMLWSFTADDDKEKMKRYQVIHSENGTKTLFDTVIPMDSELSVEDFLKTRGIEPTELKIIKMDRASREMGRGNHAMTWVSDEEGETETVEIKVEIDEEGNKTVKKTVNGEEVELTPEEMERIEKAKHRARGMHKDGKHPHRVRVIQHEEESESSGNGETKDVQIKAEIDDEGNLTVKKWVNGEEVEVSPEEMDRIRSHGEGKHKVVIIGDEGIGENVFIQKMEGAEGANVFISDGEGEGFAWTDEENVEISVEIDEDGNKKITKKVNGEEVELGPEELERIEMREGKRGKHRVIVREMDGERAHGRRQEIHERHAVHMMHADGDKDFTLVIVEENVYPNAPRRAMMVPPAPPKPPKAPVKMENKGLTFKVYPNPNDGVFTLKLNNAEKVKTNIEITDIEGRIVFEKNLGKVEGAYTEEIDLKKFGAGTYLINVIKNNERSTQKVVVQ